MILVTTSCVSDLPVDTPVGSSVLNSISVKTPPQKTIYSLEEELVLDGLEIAGVYADGQTRPVAFTIKNMNGYSADVPADELTVTVTIEDKKTTFVVKVLPLQVIQGFLTKVLDGTAEITLPSNVTSIAETVFKNAKKN